MTANPQQFLLSKLHSVRRRHRVQRAAHGLMVGALGGALVGIGLALGRLLGMGIPVWLSWVPIAAGAIGLGVFRAARTLTSREAARMIDHRYGLQDRTITALELATSPTRNGLHALQLADAIERVRAVDPRGVVPRLLPARWPGIVTAVALLGITATLVGTHQRATANVESIEAGKSLLARRLNQRVVEPLRALQHRHVQTGEITPQATELNRRLAALTMQIDLLAEEVGRAGTRRRVTLARLSEMQARIADEMAALRPDGMETALRDMAHALEQSWLTREVGQAIRSGQLREAAALLSALDLRGASEPDFRGLSRALRKLAAKLDPRGAADLRAAAEQLVDRLEQSGDDSSSPQAPLVQWLLDQARRQAIAEALATQLELIADARNAFVAGVGGTAPGRQAAGDGMPTDPVANARFQRQRLTGVRGAGPSSYRTVRVNPAAGEQPDRPFLPQDSSFNPSQESVIDRETVPLGYQQIIERYFDRLDD